MDRGTQLASSEEETQLFWNLFYFHSGNTSMCCRGLTDKGIVLLTCKYSLRNTDMQEQLLTDRTSDLHFGMFSG